MEAERIKEELEDSFGNEVEGEASELTAEEMRMMMGDEKDDTKKILLVRSLCCECCRAAVPLPRLM